MLAPYVALSGELRTNPVCTTESSKGSKFRGTRDLKEVKERTTMMSRKHGANRKGQEDWRETEWNLQKQMTVGI